MITIASLWLPILVSAVIVFVASSVIHMGPFWHRGDFAPMPRESEVLGALRPLAIPQWFVFLIVMGIFCAYIAGRTLPGGTPYPRVFQIVGATAFIGYALALCELSIWYRRSWSLTLKAALDGLIYAALTGGTFGWLWPHSTSGVL